MYTHDQNKEKKVSKDFNSLLEYVFKLSNVHFHMVSLISSSSFLSSFSVTSGVFQQHLYTPFPVNNNKNKTDPSLKHE